MAKPPAEGIMERTERLLAGKRLPKSQTNAPPATYVAPSRKGKLHLSAWLDPEYKSRMRAIQMQHPEKSLQELYAEALDDLFQKYGVPSVKAAKKARLPRKPKVDRPYNFAADVSPTVEGSDVPH
jgi:hypothetical protein